MSVDHDLSIIEAAFYAADRPLTLEEVQKTLGTSSETYAIKLVKKLSNKYEERAGPLELKKSGRDSFSLHLRDEFLPKLEGIVPKTSLTRGPLKTLAVIAYKQPVRQAEVARLRGSRTYQHVKQLLELRFIEAKPFGRTKLLRTSKKFAAYFGFEDQIDKIRELLHQMVE